LTKTSSIIKPTNQKFDDDIVYDSSIVQVKLDKKDPDYRIKKQKNSKKTTTTNKNQVFIYYTIILLLMKALS